MEGNEVKNNNTVEENSNADIQDNVVKDEKVNNDNVIINENVSNNTNFNSVNTVDVKADNHGNNKPKSKGFLIFLIFLIIIGLGVGAWYFKTQKGNKGNIIETNVENKRKSYKMNGNGLENFDLYFLKEENKEINKVYSPISIKYALEMLAEGATGETKTELDNVIGTYKSKKYTNSKNMSFANALFVKNSFKGSVKQDYTTKLQNKYNAEVLYDSFGNAKTINNWVKNKTLGLIPEIMDNDTVKQLDYALVNALAIDMEWVNVLSGFLSESYAHEKYSKTVDPIEFSGYSKIKFNNSAKEYDTITIGAVANKYDIVKTLGEEKIRQTVKEEYEKWLKESDDNEKIDDFDSYLNEYIESLRKNYGMLSKSTDFLFNDNSEVKAFAKDLKTYDGTTLQYIGIMPKSGSLTDYINKVDAKELNNIISGLKDIKIESFEEGYVTDITGYIPIFKYSYSLELMKDLKSLGIANVFDKEKADLSNLTSQKGSYISDVVHSADIEFSNEGIKAAAVSLGGGAGSAAGGFDYEFEVPVKKIDLTFDNPYLYIIRDKNTGEVWFTGTVYEPVSGSKIN